MKVKIIARFKDKRTGKTVLPGTLMDVDNIRSADMIHRKIAVSTSDKPVEPEAPEEKVEVKDMDPKQEPVEPEDVKTSQLKKGDAKNTKMGRTSRK